MNHNLLLQPPHDTYLVFNHSNLFTMIFVEYGIDKSGFPASKKPCNSETALSATILALVLSRTLSFIYL